MSHGFKEIRHNWKKYLMVEFLIVLLIFMVIFLTGLANGLGKALGSGLETMNTQGFVLVDDAEKMISVSTVKDDAVQEIMDKDASATPLTIQHGMVIPNGETEKLDVTYFVIDPAAKLNPDTNEGSNLDNAVNKVVLSESIKESGVKLGDIVEDTESNLKFEVVGFVKGKSYSHTPIAYISYETYEGMLSNINANAKVKVNAVAVDKQVEIKDYEYVDRMAVVENMPGYQAEQLTIQMIIWVLVIVSAAILAVFFYILTLQKLKQFGVMKAIGFGMGRIVAIQFSQIAFVSILGAAIGYALAIGTGMSMPASMPFHVEQTEVLFVTVAFIVIAILSSMISIVNIAKVDPVSIIGGNED